MLRMATHGCPCNILAQQRKARAVSLEEDRDFAQFASRLLRSSAPEQWADDQLERLTTQTQRRRVRLLLQELSGLHQKRYLER